jgi:hypothetical protein
MSQSTCSVGSGRATSPPRRMAVRTSPSIWTAGYAMVVHLATEGNCGTGARRVERGPIVDRNVT